MKLLALLLCGVSAFNVPMTTLDMRPTVGILTAPSDFGAAYNAEIGASYVKWAESGGARVVVIHHDEPSHILSFLLESVNGVLLTGGTATLQDEDCKVPESQYLKAVRQILSTAVAKNDAGVHFPVWATCLGMESIQTVVAQQCCLSAVPVHSKMLPLQITAEGHFSQLLQASDAGLRRALQTSSLAYHNHSYATRPVTYALFAKLRGFFNVVSVSKDLQGEFFVSAIEAKNYPIFGVMWHPEKPQFEWTSYGDDVHEPAAIEAAQYFANFFISQARLNTQSFSDELAFEAYSVYNLAPVYTKLLYEQTYLFPLE
jgi:gamma-glutamyl hydrolase